MLDKATLQLNQQRWQEVEKIIIEEGRQSSPSQRWQKLNALLRMAAGLQLLPDSASQDEEAVWARWSKLKNLYLSQGES